MTWTRLIAVTFSLLASLFASATVLVLTTEEADARRLGGGRSFGARPSYNAPYTRSAPRATTRSAAPSAAQQKNAALRQSLSKRGGLMGLLGGLALGGLLGALLFGGAFEGINFLDILIFAAIAFLLYKLLAAKRARTAPAGASATAATDPGVRFDETPAAREASGARRFDTDLLFGKGRRETPETPATPPAGFDEAQFLAGAERAYRALQAAWDTGDLETLRMLTTPALYEALERQLHEQPVQGRTEILRLQPELLKVRDDGQEWQASVLFEAELRETDDRTGQALPPKPVREVWHFVRPSAADRPTWYLDGIQQVEQD